MKDKLNRLVSGSPCAFMKFRQHGRVYGVFIKAQGEPDTDLIHTH